MGNTSLHRIKLFKLSFKRPYLLISRSVLFQCISLFLKKLNSFLVFTLHNRQFKRIQIESNRINNPNLNIIENRLKKKSRKENVFLAKFLAHTRAEATRVLRLLLEMISASHSMFWPLSISSGFLL